MRSWVLWEVESYEKLSLMGGWVLCEVKYVGKFFSSYCNPQIDINVKLNVSCSITVFMGYVIPGDFYS